MIVVPENSVQNVILAKWACDILDDTLETFGFDRYGEPLFNTMGFSVNDELACVVVAYQYAKPNVTFAIASSNPRWATRSNIEALGQWAYQDLDCKRITALAKKTNKRSRKFMEGVGFQYEGKLKKATYDSDVILYGLLKEDHHKWLRKAFNGKRTSTSAQSA